MPSEFSNIDELIKKTKTSKPEGAAQEDFQKKMTSLHDKKLEEQTQATATSLGIPYISLKGFPISLDTLAVIPQDKCLELKLVCFYKGTDSIQLASLNPQDQTVIDYAKEIGLRYQLKAIVYQISELSFNWALKLYEKVPIKKPIVKGVEITEDRLNQLKEEINSYKDLQENIKRVSISDMVTMIIAAALKTRSSDIHIEAEDKGVVIRFRIDGVLHEAAVVDKTLWKQIIARVKLVSGLKINIENAPQDGRFTIFLSNDKIDVRVSVLPTAFGDSVVMRLLRGQTAGLQFEDLGVMGKAKELLDAEIVRPNGMIITTGPTGSGKTTTLYSILQKLNKEDTKIITLEDPIEYQLEGINQSQIDHSRGYSFADGLRSVLRQDPDIVMVGEIRDLETAEVAINAALTGHLVISTLHTNSAVAAIPRFLSMGVKPFLMAPAVNAIIGQRLVRKICEDCKEPLTLDPETLAKVTQVLKDIPKESGETVNLENLTFYHGKGCETCQHIGYKGRMGIYEVFTLTPDVEDAILAAEFSENKIEALARKNGMIRMVEDGILKALKGITTVEEVFRVSE